MTKKNISRKIAAAAITGLIAVGALTACETTGDKAGNGCKSAKQKAGCKGGQGCKAGGSCSSK